MSTAFGPSSPKASVTGLSSACFSLAFASTEAGNCTASSGNAGAQYTPMLLISGQAFALLMVKRKRVAFTVGKQTMRL